MQGRSAEVLDADIKTVEEFIATCRIRELTGRLISDEC